MSSKLSLPSSPPDAASLERLGVYRIESLLGRGGMGEVYLAWDEVLERHVAIKRIRSDWLGDATHRARFLREARSVARLDHPAIVRIYHVLEREDSPYLVMEFVRGQNLSKLIAQDGIDTARALAIARGIADGLAEAHRQGLVHRDLKPANVMMTQDGGVKILDFGLAKVVGSGVSPPSEDDQLTQSHVVVGTARAMSPEQAAGQPVDHRSDLFALGSLLYEMLSGHPAFRGEHVMDTLNRVSSQEPEPLAELCPHVPPPLIELVERLLSKDPSERAQSADRVAQELAALGRSSEAELVTMEGRSRLRPTPQEDVVALADASTEIGAQMPRTETDPGTSVLRVLVVTELMGSTKLFEQLGDLRMATLSSRHDRMARDLLARYGGLEIDKTDGFLLLFERPGDAVAYALSYQQALHRQSQEEGVVLSARAAVHLGEVVLRRNLARDVTRGAKPLEVEGLAKSTAARVMSLACARQTLLTRGIFDMARHAAMAGELADSKLRWLDYGPYSFKGVDEPLEVCEVGVEGFAPLAEPPDTEQAKRAVSFSDDLMLGWRPAAGQSIPRRANWELNRRLGEGGFGEVWLARHKSGEERVFKFCFAAERLRALKREVTLFRLLRESLGHRPDIARVLDWDFEEAPYFLESEFTDGGDLVSWAESLGGLTSVPLSRRLELVAGVAEALAAAHSVGVLHKDIKPSNVLVSHDADGRPQARLTDFGIGALVENRELGAPAFTVQGLTETSRVDGSSATSGTVRYMAPELLVGKPATLQADVYALGVVLYQAVVGDFERPLAPGWRREIDDTLLCEDIAECIDGAPERRLRDAAELAERLRTLDARHQQRRVEQEAERSRQRSARLRQAAGWSGIAAIVLLVVISVFAYQTLEAKNRELKARENAEQRRRQAEMLIDFMLGDLRSALQPLGKLDILGGVGDQAMAYFAAVPESDLSDTEKASYAKALHQIGQVRFNLGQMSEAAAAFGESLAMARELAARDPKNAARQFDLGQSHFWVGSSHWGARDFEAALEQFEAYRQISKGLVERDPENATWQRELAYSYSNVGMTLEERGMLAEATRALEANVRILEGLSLTSPEDRDLSVSLATAYARLGRVSESIGQLSRARDRYEASLEMFKQIHESRPDDMELRSHLNGAFFQFGKILLSQGETVSALASLRSALELSRRLVAHEPDHDPWLAALAFDLRELALVLLALGEREEARPLIEEDSRITQVLVDQAPGHPRWRLNKACSLWSRALLDSHQGKGQRARESLETALRILRQLVTENDSLEHRLWLVRTHEKLGEIYEEAGDREQATEAWRRGTEIAEGLVAEKPSPAHLERLVRLRILAGEHADARPIIERLASMGYRRISYRAFMESHGAP